MTQWPPAKGEHAERGRVHGRLLAERGSIRLVARQRWRQGSPPDLKFTGLTRNFPVDPVV